MRICFHTVIWLILLGWMTYTGEVAAQFDVVYVKGKVYYKQTTHESDTQREVKVGDKIERTTPLDFTKDKSSYVALYNPSYGRIVIPDKEEINNHNSAGSNTSKPLRNDPLVMTFDFIQKELNGYVLLSDSAKLDLTPLIENDVRAFELFGFIDSIKILYRYKYIGEDDSIETVERPVRDFYNDFKTIPVGDRKRTLPIGKKYLYTDRSGNPIDQRKIIGYTEIIVRRPDHFSEYADPKDKTKAPRKPKQLKGTIQFRFPDSTETLKKEVQTLLNGYMVAGKNFNESVSLIVPYIEKYYGKVFRDDVEAWIRKHFTIEIKK